MAHRVKLLIVDDEVRFLRTLTQRLSLRDFDVTAVSNGQEAVEAAERDEYDLALVDLMMPGMSGDQVLDILKRRNPYLQVIILTGHGSIDSAVHCTRLGSHSYLQKPCDTEELLLVLKDAYQNRIQEKLRLTEHQIMQMLSIGASESPLSVLQKLRELEQREASGAEEE